MIIINLMGGLGNQMFQYAAARHLAEINQCPLRIDSSNFHRLTSNHEHTLQLEQFKLSAQQASSEELKQFIRPARLIKKIARALTGKTPATKYWPDKHYKEVEGSIYKADFLKAGKNLYLTGYFNSYKYSNAIKSTLLQEYTLKNPLSPESQKFSELIQSTNSISLHIRRGDYITDTAVNSCIQGIITETFYLNAVEYIAQRTPSPHFFVFSNDMPWVKANFQIPYTTHYVDCNSAQRGYEDLWLMSRCKHNITAGGSTFSWWAALLNTNPDKMVVRTEMVSNDPLYNHPKDYFPPEWLSVAS